MNIVDRMFRQNSKSKLLLEILDSVKPFIFSPAKRKPSPLEREQQSYRGELVHDVISGPSVLPDDINTQLNSSIEELVRNPPSDKELRLIAQKIVDISPRDTAQFPPWWKMWLKELPSQIRDALIATQDLHIIMVLDKQKAYEIAFGQLQTKIEDTVKKWPRYWEYLSTSLDQLQVTQDYPLKGMTPIGYRPTRFVLKKMEIELMTKYYDMEMMWDASVGHQSFFITEEDAFFTKDELLHVVIDHFTRRSDAKEIFTGFKLSSSPVPCLCRNNIFYENSEYNNTFFIFRVDEDGFRAGEEHGGVSNMWRWSV